MSYFNVKKVCAECAKYSSCSPDRIKANLRDGRCSSFKTYTRKPNSDRRMIDEINEINALHRRYEDRRA